MTKKTTKEEALFYPLAITPYEKKALFLYAVTSPERTRVFLSQGTKGTEFAKEYEINVVDSAGTQEDFKDCKQLSFFAYHKHSYILYVKKVSGRKHTLIAESLDMKNFTIVEKNVSLPLSVSIIISSYKHKKRFLSYYGDTSLYVVAASDLNDWHTSAELLSPRKDHFDSGAITVVGTIIIEQGILVLYSSHVKKTHGKKVVVGAALFSLDKPYMPALWRSEAPIWEEDVDAKTYPDRFLGAVILDHSLYIYWVSKDNEVFSKSIHLVSSGLVREKVVRQLKRHHSNPIIKPKIDNAWEKEATFNPAALHLDDKIHLLYRAIGENGMSVLGYASSKDGITIDERLEHPVFTLIDPCEGATRNALHHSPYVSGGSWAGCEDPRITHIGNRIYMTYVLFDGYHAPGVALTSIAVKDFLNHDWKWKKPVLISKPGEIQKNWMIFPEKMNGKYALIHSITPKISIEYIDDIDDEKLVIESMKMPGNDEHRWDNIMRGAGAPPLRTDYGWLVLYHAMDRRDPNKYKVGAMLLDHNDPTKILHRCTYPILEPSAVYENHGAKSGVVYVCGAVIKEDTLFVYYGGADSVVCVATENIDEFLKDLTTRIEHDANRPASLKKINKPKHI